MYNYQDIRTRTWLLGLVAAILILFVGALAPPAHASQQERPRSEPPPPQYATAFPEAPTACAQPGAAILPDRGVSASFSQSGRYSSRYDVANAFDGANSPMWLSEVWESPAWIAVDFDTTSYLVTSYDITFSNGRLKSRAPSAWTLEGSLDGKTWTVVDARTRQTGWAGTETRTFKVQEPATFNSYRLHITGDNDKRSDIVVASIGELSLYTDCPQPEVLVSHNVVPWGSSCPSSFSEAVAMNPPGSVDKVELTKGQAMFSCVNVNNVGPGIAQSVRIDHPLFSETSFVDLGPGGQGIASVAHTLRNPNSRLSAVKATATDLLGNTASQAKDSIGLVVTKGFELQVAAVDFGSSCPKDFGPADAFPVRTTVEIGSTIHVCYSVISLSDVAAPELSISHSLVDEQPTTTNLPPGGGWLHSTNYVVTADDAGATTVLLYLTNQLGDVVVIDGADLVLAPVDAPQPDVEIRVSAVEQGESCPTSWGAAVAASDSVGVAAGTPIFYCIAVINHGPGVATGLDLKHDAFSEVVTLNGDLGVGTVWLHSQLVEADKPTVGLTTATVWWADVYGLNGDFTSDQTKVRLTD